MRKMGLFRAVKSHSRSLKIVPFDTAHITFYYLMIHAVVISILQFMVTLFYHKQAPRH